MLNADVTIETHIDKVTSADGKIKVDYDTIQTTTGNNLRRDEFDAKFDVINSANGLEAEDAKWNVGNTDIETWKKGNPVVLEAGDTVEYLLEVKHYTSYRQIAAQIECILPDTIDKNAGVKIQAVYEVYENGEWVVKDNGCAEKVISGNNIKKKSSTNELYLTAEDFPQDEQSSARDRDEYNEGSGWIRVPIQMRKLFKITVKIDTAANSYDVANAKKIEAKILKIGRRDTNWEWDPDMYQPLVNIAQEKDTVSRDYFICKQYNVSLNKYISGLTRSDGSGITSGEYIVDNNSLTITGDNRRVISEEVKNDNPIYVENGDIVIYTIELINAANAGKPYYNPQDITVYLTDTLPTATSQVMSVSVEGKECDWTQNGQTLTANITIGSDQTKKVICKVKVNDNKDTTYDYDVLRTNLVTISNVANCNGKTTNSGKIINITQGKLTAADHFKIKEHNVVIDKYISEVSHTQSRGGTQVTYAESDFRRSSIASYQGNNGWGNVDETKNNSPVSVEYGDKVTYKIKIYNTTNDNYYTVGRENAPYKQPQKIYVDIEDTLPEKYSSLQIENAGVTPEITTNKDGKPILILNDVEVPAGSVKEIKVSLIVEEAEKDSVHTNTVKMTRITNINDYLIINNGNRLSCSDKYQLNDYNVKLDEYVSQYNAEMEKYNIAHGFTKGVNGTSGEFANGTEGANSYSTTKPLDLEKYETLTFATKVTNNVKGGEDENYDISYRKYNTRVRPTVVNQTIDYGLEKIGFQAIWYKSDGKMQDITNAVTHDITEDSNQQRTYTYTITDENIILSPEEYIVYYLTVEVTESNMYLGQLRSESKIITLTNVNRDSNTEITQPASGVAEGAKHTRIITSQNIETKTSDEDYVRLKDVVIAGTVWLDADKNGYNNGESGKQGIAVKLYKAGATKPLQTVYTNENGFYTFDREWKAKTKDNNRNYTSNEYIEYYVEFEYDGITYKAVEIYGGDADGEADGMHTLGGVVGSSTWRQGYTDLPNSQLDKEKSGNTNYMIDSNAYEFDDVRNTFNSKYETIGYDQSYTQPYNEEKGTFTSSVGLGYNKNGHTSTFKESTSDSKRIMTARSFITQKHNLAGAGITNNLQNTNILFLSEILDETKYKGHFNTNPETEYLKFINLGLVRREEVDLSIESDVYSVKTTINGEEMTYDFNDNDADSTAPNDENPKIYDYEVPEGESPDKYQANAYRLNDAYNLDLYKADFNYRHDKYYDQNDVLSGYKGEASELTVEVTYRIRITNNKIENDEPNLGENKDIPIETALNEIAIYYDQNFMNPYSNVTTKVKDPTTGLLTDKTVSTVRARYGTEDELDNNSNNVIDLNDKNCILTVNSHGESASRYLTNAKLANNGDRDIDGRVYSVLYLSGTAMDEIYLKEGESRFIDITFTVDKGKLNGVERTLKITDDEDMGLEMIAEIGAYTTKYGETYKHKALAGKIAGLVDRDSNPGNLLLGSTDEESRIEEYGNYEDDTYKVGIKMKVKSPGDASDSRYISGIVWDDARSEQVGSEETGAQYIGNGEYNTNNTNNENANTNPNVEHINDKPVEGVKVSLVEIVQFVKDGKSIYYEYPAKDSNGKLVECITNENGEYILADFMPGYYKVRFDYGYDATREDNIIYNGQDYKSTTYYNNGYYKNGFGDNIGASSNNGYFDKAKEQLKIEAKSDAQDDEIRRLNVNSYSETMTTSQAQVFARANAKSALLTKNTHMYADSTMFYVKPEEQKSGDTNINATDEKFTYRWWNMTNVDFGLEYRPESAIKLDKNISSIELVTSDGETLVKLYFEKDKDGNRIINKNKSIGQKNVQFVPDKESAQGFVYINMDTDILTGCTINVDYEMAADNNSEIDRISKNLYDIRYETSAIAKKYNEKVYVSDKYNANGTAAEFLANQYYDESYEFDTETGTENYKYLTQLKKSYNSEGTTTIDGDQTVDGTGYYGMYLGQTYYTGEIGKYDVITELKVDKILDYIDNDMTFNLSENSGKNRLWQTTTSSDLKDMLSTTRKDSAGNLIDKKGVRYDTENRSNLVLSVDDNNRGQYPAEENRTVGNALLSRFLKTTKITDNANEYQGKISLITQKILSVDDVAKGTGLTYENMAEIIQFTTLTGRRTTLPDEDGNGSIIGNTDPGDNDDDPDPGDTGEDGSDPGPGNNNEDDTDTTEIITISPPTGLPVDK